MSDERHETVEQPVTNCNALNAAKMREALLETKSVIAKCMEILNRIPDGCEYDGLIDEVADELCDLRESHVNAALTAPPRNCDIGTPDEHLVTHRKWCWEHDCKPTDSCKLCVARWAQMPYEEGGAK